MREIKPIAFFWGFAHCGDVMGDATIKSAEVSIKMPANERTDIPDQEVYNVGDSTGAHSLISDAHLMSLSREVQHALYDLRALAKADALNKRTRHHAEVKAVSTLTAVKAALGRRYKSAIRRAWMTGDYETEGLGAWDSALQQMRNTFGPTWLNRV